MSEISIIEKTNTIKDKISNLIHKLESKKEKYPNLCKAWNTALNYKLEKIIKMIDNCNNFCDKVNDVIPNDLSPQLIGLLYILNNNYLKNKH